MKKDIIYIYNTWKEHSLIDLKTSITVSGLWKDFQWHLKKCIDFYFVLAYILPLFWLIEYYFYVFVSFVVFCSHRNAKINYVNYNKTMLTCNLFMSASKIIVMAYKRYQSLSKITVWYRNGEICLLTSCMTSWIQKRFMCMSTCC